MSEQQLVAEQYQSPDFHVEAVLEELRSRLEAKRRARQVSDAEEERTEISRRAKFNVIESMLRQYYDRNTWHAGKATEFSQADSHSHSASIPQILSSIVQFYQDLIHRALKPSTTTLTFREYQQYLRTGPDTPPSPMVLNLVTYKSAHMKRIQLIQRLEAERRQVEEEAKARGEQPAAAAVDPLPPRVRYADPVRSFVVDLAYALHPQARINLFKLLNPAASPTDILKIPSTNASDPRIPDMDICEVGGDELYVYHCETLAPSTFSNRINGGIDSREVVEHQKYLSLQQAIEQQQPLDRLRPTFDPFFIFYVNSLDTLLRETASLLHLYADDAFGAPVRKVIYVFHTVLDDSSSQYGTVNDSIALEEILKDYLRSKWSQPSSLPDNPSVQQIYDTIMMESNNKPQQAAPQAIPIMDEIIDPLLSRVARNVIELDDSLI